MKVFVAGGSGAIGRRLVPLLVTLGYDVAATTRSTSKARLLYELGAEPVVVDALDRDAVLAAFKRVEPEIVVDQLTGLSAAADLRNFDRAFADTNTLRTTGTVHLLDASYVTGVRRFVAQSFGNWNYERRGDALKSEVDPLDPDPPATMTESLLAIRRHETAVLGAHGIDGVVLRFGNFYGPGTGLSAGGELVELVRARRLPVIGDGAGVWSFVHVDDAATATVAAIERGTVGTYNVCDDDPAPASVWLPELARILGAEAPRHAPRWLGRLAAGEAVTSMMTEIRGASNARARLELGWNLRYGSWRDGFRSGLVDSAADLFATARMVDLPLAARPVLGR